MDDWMVWTLSGGLGVAAGLITTVAGMGGGLMLVTALAMIWRPGEALTATALALWVGNLHRVLMYRHAVNWAVARAWILGVLPGAIVGGALAVGLPDVVIRTCILTLTLLALTRVVGLWSWRPPAWILAPAGVGVGVMCGAAGGAGVLSGPLLLAAGLEGVSYVATNAAGSVAMHMGRIGAYGAGGLLTRQVLVSGAILAVCITAGNLIGALARRRLGQARWAEVGVLSICVTLALLGF